MAGVLNEVELRVLGVLIEKSLSQPGGYPLTLNAVLLGANQSQNREPVLDLTEADVATAIHTLGGRQLVRHAPTAPGARSNRFEHLAEQCFGWDKREQAVMAELILRDRQTPGELRSRANRMTPIPDLEAVAAILQDLMGRDPPCVEELQREPGRSAIRFRQLLAGDDGSESADATVPRTLEEETSGGSCEEASLARRVSELEERVAHLSGVVAGLLKSRTESADCGDAPVV